MKTRTPRDETLFSDLIGKVIYRIDYREDDEELWIHCMDDSRYVMGHDQDCCENVTLENPAQDLSSIVGSPVLVAEARYVSLEYERYRIWKVFTFYHLSTRKASIVLRWYGESDGTYAVDVGFWKVDP
jgi:hypothetical protein